MQRIISLRQTISTVLLAALLFVPLTQAHAEQIHMAYISDSPGSSAPYWIAKEAVFYKKHGLDVELIFINGSTRGIQSLVAGDLNFTGAVGTSAINGKLAGEWDYGYTPFRIDATEHVNLQGKNVVAVRVDTSNHGSRWYPGAGIYRKVMLEVRDPVHIGQWGVFVTTPEVADNSATVQVKVSVAVWSGLR